MKIAWFTPFSKESAIGNYSVTAAMALSKYADVDIFAFEKGKLHTTDLRIIYYDTENILSLLNAYDLCIYNMGNHAGYHSPIFEVMRQRRGIVIAHDICFQDFFHGYYIELKNSIPVYYNAMVKLYGHDDANKILEAGNTFEEWRNLDFIKYNMSEELFPHSLGLVVHSKYHQNIIGKKYHGPICVVPLLYIKEQISPKKMVKNFVNYPSDKLNILTVGYVNPNKRIHSVVEAIGKSDILRENVTYTIVGSLSNQPYSDMLNGMIEQYGISDNIRLIGYANDQDLELYYQKTDIVINLRGPALEGASASLVEQMNSGKNIIVSNTGMYAEMPDDCVIKIDTENEVEQLMNKLETFVTSPALYKRYGKNAKEFASCYFSCEQYGEKLYNFIQSVNFLAPLHSLTELVGQEFNSIGISPDMKICKTVAEEIELLFKNKTEVYK